MRPITACRHFLTSGMLLVLLASVVAAQDRSVPDGISVRDGYTLSVAESTIVKPRFLAADDQKNLYVSLPDPGRIMSCRDRDGDGYFESVETFVGNHPSAHGMCWYKGWLYFSESGAIFKARDTDGDGRADEEKTVIPQGKLPVGGGHWWRSLLVHKDRIYTSIGDSGNITNEMDTPRQKIWRYAIDGSDEQLWCSGIRNTEKLVIRPGTDEVWGMDHGSDWFGREIEKKHQGSGQPITDRNPPCEMNHYTRGGFYGHPFIVGNKLPRYEYMDRDDIVELAAKTIAPAWETGAHWAPNSMTFYTGKSFKGLTGSAFVAYHGSWNRSEKVGYAVTCVLFDQGRPYGELVFVNFLDENGQDYYARPVDTLVWYDGSLLISDDGGNRIYRLSKESKP